MNKTSRWYVSDARAFVVTVCYRNDRSNESNSSRKRYKERGWLEKKKKKIQEKEKSKRTIYQDIIVRKQGDI